MSVVGAVLGAIFVVISCLTISLFAWLVMLKAWLKFGPERYDYPAVGVSCFLSLAMFVAMIYHTI